ncbi:MAG: hypothetical protein Solumvirus2_17 [Solumvirus sp.]|uniref:Transmembrane protein n=1 Tax=Solumvirus sp. TaxID=2487773 RepID=A0A3G5AGI3_9VIRU|nr:MAG: hypothetical protein Solumvirus2_17 [Solumvirus sp.]
MMNTKIIIICINVIIILHCLSYFIVKYLNQQGNQRGWIDTFYVTNCILGSISIVLIIWVFKEYDTTQHGCDKGYDGTQFRCTAEDGTNNLQIINMLALICIYLLIFLILIILAIVALCVSIFMLINNNNNNEVEVIVSFTRVGIENSRGSLISLQSVTVN